MQKRSPDERTNDQRGADRPINHWFCPATFERGPQTGRVRLRNESGELGRPKRAFEQRILARLDAAAVQREFGTTAAPTQFAILPQEESGHRGRWWFWAR